MTPASVSLLGCKWWHRLFNVHSLNYFLRHINRSVEPGVSCYCFMINFGFPIISANSEDLCCWTGSNGTNSAVMILLVERKAKARSVMNSRSSCKVRVSSLTSLTREVALRKWKWGFFIYAEFTWFEIFKAALLKILSLLGYDAMSTGKSLWTSGRACCLCCLFASVHGLVSYTT